MDSLSRPFLYLGSKAVSKGPNSMVVRVTMIWVTLGLTFPRSLKLRDKERSIYILSTIPSITHGLTAVAK